MTRTIIRTLFTLILLAGLSISPAQAEKFAYYHLDALGSPVAATDEAGNLLWREDYTPYGDRLLNDPAAANDSRWYTGHVHDQATGLTYMGARYYDPTLGRFMGVDPVAFTEANPHSFNRFAYANNNPYTYFDPDGNAAFSFLAWRGDLSPAQATELIHAETRALTAAGVTTGVVSAGLAAPGAGLLDLVSEVADVPLLSPKGIIKSVVRKGVKPTAKQLKKFQKQLQQHGRKSLERSQRKIERRLNKHLKNLEQYKKDRGYTSSVEREIRNFERELEAIKQTLRGGS